jgi:hypothetical protein
MSPPKKNGAKALTMSAQNARAIKELAGFLSDHAKEEIQVWNGVKTQVTEIHIALLGDVKDPDRRGWLERIRNLEDYVGSWKRATWLAVGGIISGVIAIIMALAKSS